MSEQLALTVTQALGVVNDRLGTMPLKVEGEVSGFDPSQRYAAFYFTIRDDASTMSVKVWKNVYDASGVTLRNGMVVELTGRFNVWAPKGSFSFDISSIQVAGEGRLRAQLAALAEKLRAEGLMNDARKKPLPLMPTRIGVITSPNGKAVHDVLRTLKRRFPIAEVLFFGTLVEGEQAPRMLVQAIRQADESEADVLLLVRGGGSFEDMLPFSDESVVRAVASVSKPIVTGIGHEPDQSIADLVSDYRASTPTAAAEAVTPLIDDLIALLERQSRRLAVGLSAQVSSGRSRLKALAERPVMSNPSVLLNSSKLALDDYHRRLEEVLPRQIQVNKLRLNHAVQRFVSLGAQLLNPHEKRFAVHIGKLESLSPLKVLQRGYAAVFDETGGQVVDSVVKVHKGDTLGVRLSDGTLRCEVLEIASLEYDETGA